LTNDKGSLDRFVACERQHLVVGTLSAVIELKNIDVVGGVLASTSGW
jgi:hypothetical protein